MLGLVCSVDPLQCSSPCLWAAAPVFPLHWLLSAIFCARAQERLSAACPQSQALPDACLIPTLTLNLHPCPFRPPGRPMWHDEGMPSTPSALRTCGHILQERALHIPAGAHALVVMAQGH